MHDKCFLVIKLDWYSLKNCPKINMGNIWKPHCYQFLKRPYRFERDPKETHFLLEKRPKRDLRVPKKETPNNFFSPVVLSLLNNKHLNK